MNVRRAIETEAYGDKIRMERDIKRRIIVRPNIERQFFPVFLSSSTNTSDHFSPA
jgi:hypothetical protein